MPAKAQQGHAAQSSITVVRKPGREDGEAQMIVMGKIRKIAPHAVATWLVRGGEGALILVLQPAKRAMPKQYILRYYDLDSGRRRVLGAVPFTAGSVVETEAGDDRWSFALSGTDPTTGAPVVIVGDDQAIPGLLPDTSAPGFDRDEDLAFSQAGESKTAKLDLLLGRTLHEIYTPPQTTLGAPKYLQVFPNGQAMVELKDGSVQKARWNTDGTTVNVFADTAKYAFKVDDLSSIKGVPAGQRFGVRLTQELSSRTTHEGDTMSAVSITPVIANGEILIPAGSKLQGKVTEADNVGWGFKHETASLTIKWITATTPAGHVLNMDARIFAVENAQEKVTDQGKIQGVRSTGTIGHSVENGVLTFAGIDPVAYIFASASGSAVLGFAEPEILYHGGTELILENAKPLITATVYPPSVMPMENSAEGRDQLQAFVKRLPFRTQTKGSNKVSDLTNLVFIGSSAALERAFAAAGWLSTEDLDAGSTFRTVKTGNQTYTQAPMSVLLLDERPPLFTFSKTTNTFSSRHHLRIFPSQERYDGQAVLTSSSTQDIGIAFSRKQKTFIHVIDQHIDNERSKVVNDLMFTGCVTSLDMVERPWVPIDAYNSTGDRLLTDREAAVVRINNCDNPVTTPAPAAPAPNRFQRSTRNTSLTIRNGLYRGNLIYQGIAGGFMARSYLRSSGELAPDTGAWRKPTLRGRSTRATAATPDFSAEDRQMRTRLKLRRMLRQSRRRKKTIAGTPHDMNSLCTAATCTCTPTFCLGSASSSSRPSKRIRPISSFWEIRSEMAGRLAAR